MRKESYLGQDPKFGRFWAKISMFLGSEICSRPNENVTLAVILPNTLVMYEKRKKSLEAVMKNKKSRKIPKITVFWSFFANCMSISWRKFFLEIGQRSLYNAQQW